MIDGVANADTLAPVLDDVKDVKPKEDKLPQEKSDGIPTPPEEEAEALSEGEFIYGPSYAVSHDPDAPTAGGILNTELVCSGHGKWRCFHAPDETNERQKWAIEDDVDMLQVWIRQLAGLQEWIREQMNPLTTSLPVSMWGELPNSVRLVIRSMCVRRVIHERDYHTTLAGLSSGQTAVLNMLSVKITQVIPEAFGSIARLRERLKSPAQGEKRKRENLFGTLNLSRLVTSPSRQKVVRNVAPDAPPSNGQRGGKRTRANAAQITPPVEPPSSVDDECSPVVDLDCIEVSSESPPHKSRRIDSSSSDVQSDCEAVGSLAPFYSSTAPPAVARCSIRELASLGGDRGMPVVQVGAPRQMRARDPVKYYW